MYEAELDVGARFVALHPPPGEVLLVAITGSHLYGFPSPDSDLDLKGIHLAPTRSVLGLKQPAEAHDRLEVFEGVECDLTTNEARKALETLLRGGGNMLERCTGPLQVVASQAATELRDLALGAVSKAFFRHYRGFLRGVQREHLRGEPHAKSLLYGYRVALTGVHLLRTGEVEADLGVLAPRYGFPDAVELIARKRATREKLVLPATEDAHHRAGWPRLEAALTSAFVESELPEHPTNIEACHAWLVARRLAAVQSS